MRDQLAEEEAKRKQMEDKLNSSSKGQERSQAKVAELEGKLEAANSDLEASRADLEASKTELEDVRSRLETAQERAKIAGRELTSAQAAVAELEEEKTKKAEEVLAVKEERDAMRAQTSELQGKASELANRVKSLERKGRALVDERDELEQSKKQGDKIVAAAKEAQASVEAERNALVKKLKVVKAELGSALKKLTDAESIIENELTCIKCMKVLDDPVMNVEKGGVTCRAVSFGGLQRGVHGSMDGGRARERTVWEETEREREREREREGGREGERERLVALASLNANTTVRRPGRRQRRPTASMQAPADDVGKVVVHPARAQGAQGDVSRLN